jgi:hypothetical protein
MKERQDWGGSSHAAFIVISFFHIGELKIRRRRLGLAYPNRPELYDSYFLILRLTASARSLGQRGDGLDEQGIEREERETKQNKTKPKKTITGEHEAV